MGALLRYDVLDTAPEDAFDRIARLARTILETSGAFISLIGRDARWLRSRQGIGFSEDPREASFCDHAIQQDVPLIVRDAREDARFRDNPLVLGEPKIRFYLGIPLRAPKGFNIGTLCVVDQRPRDPGPGQIAVMQDLARLTMDQIELHQLAMSDSLTGAMTRRGFMLEAQHAFEQARRYFRPLSCIMLDLDHFKSVNDSHGHAAGDTVLRMVAGTCRAAIRSTDNLGRFGGEEFAILLPETDLGRARAMAERLRLRIATADNIFGAGSIRVTASLGISELDAADPDVTSLLGRADEAMYRAKHTGRDRVAAAPPRTHEREPPMLQPFPSIALYQPPMNLEEASFAST
jgi:diguanylate cyclase (GGDEF)-like protein